MEFAAVLFDMDGILIDTDQAIADLWSDLAAEWKVPLSPADLSVHVYGCAPEHTIDTVFASLGDRDRAQVLDRVREAEPELGFVPVPYAAALVRDLAGGGVPLALVTGGSSTRAERALRALGIDDCFTAAVTWGEANRGKPAPDCYLLAARRLGVHPADCLAFEDTSGGVRAAVAAGSCCIGVNPLAPAALLEPGARHGLRGFEEVRFDGEGPSLRVSTGESYRFAPSTGSAPV